MTDELNWDTAPEVERLATEFRKKHNALDWSANVDQLIGLNGYEQDVYPTFQPFSFSSWKTFLDKEVKPLATKLRKKVKALVSLKEQVILLADDLPEPQKPFAKAHELGHSVIPWHNEILMVCDEHDLKPSCRKQMEFEANTFAAEIIFPRELLQPFYKNYPMSFETVLAIKEASGGSIASAANAYVKHHPKVCCMLTLKDIQFDPDTEYTDETQRMTLVRKTMSPSAPRSAFSNVGPNQKSINAKHGIYVKSREYGVVQTVGLRVKDKFGTVHEFTGSVYNNRYNVFCLMFPRT